MNNRNSNLTSNNSNSNRITVNAPVTVNGNADRGTAEMIGAEISRQVARVIENQRYTNLINPAFA